MPFLEIFKSYFQKWTKIYLLECAKSTQESLSMANIFKTFLFMVSFICKSDLTLVQPKKAMLLKFVTIWMLKG